MDRNATMSLTSQVSVSTPCPTATVVVSPMSSLSVKGCERFSENLLNVTHVKRFNNATDSPKASTTLPLKTDEDYPPASSQNSFTTKAFDSVKVINYESRQFEQQSQLIEDTRTLQLALELSMVGLNDDQCEYFQAQQSFPFSSQSELQQLDFNPSAVNAISSVITSTSLNNPFSNSTSSISTLLVSGGPIDDRTKKSQNMTECVPVPSSEHVAEIVGRQGCKIKALRAKTNTYIKTPVRGEEPVFVVTGRKEDVSKAKREILSAADHFTLIRATRKPYIEEIPDGASIVATNLMRSQSGPLALPGQITIQVRVPYRVVGLVVGPKGATIKHIQHETHTYIVTPSREKEPIFEVTGFPENVQTAKKQIEAHIAVRTGNSCHNNNTILSGILGMETNEISAVGTINSLNQILHEDISPEFVASFYQNGICSSVDHIENNLPKANEFNTCFNLPQSNLNAVKNLKINSIIKSDPFIVQQSDAHLRSSEIQSVPQVQDIEGNKSFQVETNEDIKPLNTTPNFHGNKNFAANNANTRISLPRSCSSASSTASSKSTNNSAVDSSSPPELMNIWKNLGDSLDMDEGIGDSPNIWNLSTSLAAPLGLHCSQTALSSPTDSLIGEINTASNNQQQSSNSSHLASGGSSNAHNKNNYNSSSLRRQCFICSKKNITTALVPCGHNMFCMDCANRICAPIDAVCPVCNSVVYHAIRILA